jgi:integrase
MKTPMSYSLRFRFRKNYKAGRQQLICRLRVNGVVATDYGSDVRVPAEHFDIKAQQVLPYPVGKPDSKERLTMESVRKYNSQIATVLAQHEEIYNFQSSLRYDSGKRYRPSAESIKRQWLFDEEPPMREGPPPIKLLDAYREWLADPDTRDGKDEATLNHYFYGLHYLEMHLRTIDKPDLEVLGLTPGWGLTYHKAIQAYFAEENPNKSFSPGRATRYVRLLSKALDRLILLDRLLYNPFASLKLPRHKDKPIRYLNEVQITKLWLLDLIDTANVVRNWALLCCYTGLDYADAVKVAQSPEEFMMLTEAGPKLVYQRLKAGEQDWGECHIPLLYEAETLLGQAGDWPVLENQTMNRYLHMFEGLIGCKHSITTKMLRKTAGAVFLLRGVRVQAVQKILGHKFITTTQKHYIKILPSVVDEDMHKLFKNTPMELPRPSKTYYPMPGKKQSPDQQAPNP